MLNTINKYLKYIVEIVLTGFLILMLYNKITTRPLVSQQTSHVKTKNKEKN